MRVKTHANLFITLITFLFSVSSAHAQNKSAQPAGQTPTQQSQPASSPAKIKDEYIKAIQDYKASLQSVLVSCEANVQQVSDRLSKLKDLYDQGIISRLEFEKSQSELAAAQAKVDETRKQIAASDVSIAEAMKPPAAIPSSPAIAGRREPLWSTGNAWIDAVIRQNGTRYAVDPYLIFRVMEQESHFNPYAVSPKGARGLMQLMPDTAARFGVTNPDDPAQSIMAGTRYLKELMQMFGGKVELVLASYNAGEGAVIKYGRKVPPFKETQDYVRLISSRYLHN